MIQRPRKHYSNAQNVALVTQVNSVHDLDFARAERDPDPKDLDEAMELLSAALEQ